MREGWRTGEVRVRVKAGCVRVLGGSGSGGGGVKNGDNSKTGGNEIGRAHV